MVEFQTTHKQKWTLTAQALDKLLAALDADRERAGELYELARHRLVKFFEWRGCGSPEEYADEAINRAARRLDAGELIEDVNSYLGGVARLLLLENFKEQERRQAAFDYIERTAPVAYETRLDGAEENEEQARLRCLENCLAKLPSEQRELIIRYYTDEASGKIDERKKLSEILGIPLNALRIRAHRIRQRLEKCVGEGLLETSTRTK